jgi:hypothetical protein
MRVNITILVIVSALLISTAAIGQTTTPAPSPNAAAATPPPAPVHNKDDDVYCRSTAKLGSFIETRVCHTQREWKQISEQSRATLNNMTDQRSLSGLH